MGTTTPNNDGGQIESPILVEGGSFNLQAGSYNPEDFVSNESKTLTESQTTKQDDLEVLQREMSDNLNDFKKKQDDNIESIKKAQEDRIKSLEDRQNSFEKDQLIKIIQILALFIALFTFTSLEFQLFRNTDLNLYQTLGLSFIFLGSLLSFVLILNYLISMDKRNYQTVFLSISMIMLVVLGAVFYDVGTRQLNSEKIFKINDVINQKVDSEIIIKKVNEIIKG